MKRKPAAVVLVTVIAVLALVLLPAALAAKGGAAGAGGGGKPGGGGGGGGGSYSAWVDQSAPYRFGQTITVGTNTPVYPDNTGPWIDLTCRQNGVEVLAVTHAGFEGGWYYDWPFSLGPTYMWTGGAADCSVVVSHQSRNKKVVDATTSFRVDA